MKSPLACYAIGSMTVLTFLSASANNWPGWRGTEGTGLSNEKNLPLKWSTKENVRWHVPLPGPGNSSPIVWGNRVFVAQAVSSEDRRTIMCPDRDNGKLLWQSGVTYTEREQTQQNNPFCSATPVTDGERVIASFGSAGVYCYGMDGKELWHRDLGKMNHMFGNAASPILYGDLCLLNFGPDEKARLIAMNKRTGETIWEVEPPKVDPSEQPAPGGFGGGPGGPGGRGGGGGFGPGMFLGAQMFSQADKNKDEKLTKAEFSALADSWFDKLDSEKSGKVSQDQFTEKFRDLLPQPEGNGPPGGRGLDGAAGSNGGRGGGPGRFVGPGFFSAADTDKDGSLTRTELKGTFEKWFTAWDSEKSGSITEEKLREGLNAALPRPNFGGGGGGRGPGGPGGGRGGGMGGMGGSWSTPLIVKAGGHDELIMSFPNRLVGYDPRTGAQLWLSKGLGSTIYTSPTWGEGTLVAMTSGMGGGPAIAIKPGGSGDVTESQRLWRLERVKNHTGSGVTFESHFYAISDDGFAECFELKTGNKVWEERLKGSGSRNSSWSSILLAEGKIYIPNQSGDVFVLRASPKFELLATNSIGEPTNASLAASGGELFLRTDKGLWCIADRKP